MAVAPPTITASALLPVPCMVSSPCENAAGSMSPASHSLLRNFKPSRQPSCIGCIWTVSPSSPSETGCPFAPAPVLNELEMNAFMMNGTTDHCELPVMGISSATPLPLGSSVLNAIMTSKNSSGVVGASSPSVVSHSWLIQNLYG